MINLSSLGFGAVEIKGNRKMSDFALYSIYKSNKSIDVTKNIIEIWRLQVVYTSTLTARCSGTFWCRAGSSRGIGLFTFINIQ